MGDYRFKRFCWNSGDIKMYRRSITISSGELHKANLAIDNVIREILERADAKETSK